MTNATMNVSDPEEQRRSPKGIGRAEGRAGAQPERAKPAEDSAARLGTAEGVGADTPTAADLIQWAADADHRPTGRVCPGCDGDLYATAIIHLAYVFDECSCSAHEFTHLIEQLWHLACLQGRHPELDRAAASVLYLIETKEARGRWSAHAQDRVDALRAALKARTE